MEKKRQIIIILWKWNNLGEGVNGAVFKKRKLEAHFNNIQLGKEGKHKYYNELAVENSDLCPNPTLVQVNIYKDNADTERLLYCILERYTGPQNEVLLFLHRSHQFDDKDVQAIISRFGKNNIKCFLFADGRDLIYYAAQKSGLLNDVGGFFMQRDNETGEYVETFDEEKAIVKQPYFDRVWNHYKGEFQKKVFELKEEIFSCWFDLLLPSQPELIQTDVLLKKLQHRSDRVLVFRIKSFLGMYKVLNGKKAITDPVKKGVLLDELKKVVRLEKNEGKSYLFDDALANLEIEKKRERPLVVETYEEVTEQLSRILFQHKNAIHQGELRSLANKLNDLVRVIPGEFSN